ncbi:MAG: rod shape-determining protein MreC [Coriobacteriia bacterium]
MKLPQPERPSGALGVVIALVVVSLVITTVWYREGDRGPIHKLRTGVQTAAAPLQAAGELVTRPVRGVFAWASDLGVSRSQLAALRRQNMELRTSVAGLQEARQENERLRALFGFVKTSNLQAVGARVIGRPTTSYERVITVDRGSADGIKIEMPVLAGDGLLGQTISVTQHSARVRLITDARSGVSAMIQASRAEGVVKGMVGGGVAFAFVSREATAKAGDVIITSGFGGIYPKGLLVGEIISASQTPSSLFQDIRVAPAADLAGLEEVVVLTSAAPVTAIGSGE